MTEFEELKANWVEHSRRLEEGLRLNREILRAARLNSVESKLRRESVYAGCEAGLWLLIVVAVGSFIAGHIGTPSLAVSAVLADAMSIGMAILLIRRMVGALRMDYSQPIAVIQKQVEALRMLRIRAIKWGLLCGTLLWLPWMAIVLRVFLDVNIYRGADVPWLISNVLFGLALLLAAIGASKKYADRMDRSPFIQRLMKDLAGTNLNAAERFLARLREFERE